jgi:hypothetical protein
MGGIFDLDFGDIGIFESVRNAEQVYVYDFVVIEFDFPIHAYRNQHKRYEKHYNRHNKYPIIRFEIALLKAEIYGNP